MTSSAAADCLLRNAWICGEYYRTRQAELVDATGQHLAITVVSVLAGLGLSLPLALGARRYRKVEGLVLGASSALYTVPSLAMFALLLPVTGLSATTVVIGLALYTLTILVRNLLAGLDAVPADVVEAAQAMGYGRRRLLWSVELPLALPAVMAGIRVATVSTVALTTVGAIVGFGGLGNLLYDGVLTQFRAQVLAASALCVLLAFALDLLLVGLQGALTPWARGAAR